MRALIDDRYKLLTTDVGAGFFELYDLVNDPTESKDLAAAEPGILSRMKEELLAWDATMDASFAGEDYPEGKVDPADPDPVNWFETDRYRAYEAELKSRPEYRRYYEGKRPGEGKKAKE